MKMPAKKVALITLAVLVTAANGGFLGYTLLHTSANDTEKSKSFKVNQTDVVSSKQHQVDKSQQGTKLASGSYRVTTLHKSRKEPTSKGSLVVATNKSAGGSFILATDKSFNLDATNLAEGWTAQNLSDDPLWAPGACSSKPTLVLQGKYIFIDDGKTKPTDTYSSYLVYNLSDGSYNYFGGDNFSDTQAKHEKILLATNENDQLVFYIDQTDESGPLSESTTFKHARGSEHGYIIRRVIDAATMKYTDYRLTYTAPADTSYYYLTMGAATADSPTKIYLDDDTATYGYDGIVANNAVTYTARQIGQVAPLRSGNGPFDSDLEKQLENPLMTALPDFNSGPLYDTSINATHFMVQEIGQHADLQFVIATARTGKINSTPAIYNKQSKTVYPMTKKAFLNMDSYVPLGAL